MYLKMNEIIIIINSWFWIIKINDIDVEKLYDLLIKKNKSKEVALCFKRKFSFVFKILLYKNVFLKMKKSIDWCCLKWIFYLLNLFRNTVIRSFLMISIMNYSAKLFLYPKVNKIFFRILKTLKDNYRILMRYVWTNSNYNNFRWS